MVCLQVSRSFPGRLRALGSWGRQLTSIGILALLLVMVGIYSVVSFDVSHRAREVAIRIAVGSTGMQVMLLIVRQVVSLIAVGVGAGSILTIVLFRILERLQLGTKAVDVPAYIIAGAIIACAGTAASVLSVRHVVSIDPNQVLRGKVNLSMDCARGC